MGSAAQIISYRSMAEHSRLCLGVPTFFVQRDRRRGPPRNPEQGSLRMPGDAFSFPSHLHLGILGARLRSLGRFFYFPLPCLCLALPAFLKSSVRKSEVYVVLNAAQTLRTIINLTPFVECFTFSAWSFFVMILHSDKFTQCSLNV